MWKKTAIFFHVSFIIYTKSCFCINEKGVIYTKWHFCINEKGVIYTKRRFCINEKGVIYIKWRFCINENLYFVLPKLQKEYDKGADKSSNKYTFGAGILP